MEPNRKHRKIGIWVALGIFFVLLLCISSYMVFSQLIREKRDEDAFDALIRQIGQDQPTAASAPTDGAAPQGVSPTEPPKTAMSAPTAANFSTQSAAPQGVSPTEPPKTAMSAPTAASAATDSAAPQAVSPTGSSMPEFHKYDALYAQNHDLFGWVCIDGTALNYPVMYTPDDPERYLHRAFDGTDSTSGVPFLDAGCFLGCGNYIIHGHHMKNGSMFAVLPKYADEAFWRKHPMIRFDTLREPGEYEVMAAFYAKVSRSDDENAFCFYRYTNLSDPETFDEFLNGVSSAALYDTGVTASYGDQLLTLSTCSYHVTDGRFVIVAKKSS